MCPPPNLFIRGAEEPQKTYLAKKVHLAPQAPYTQEEWITLLRSRDQKAFSALYNNYARALLGVISAIVKDREEAEDVLQVAFLKIWTNFSSFDPAKGRLYTWMLNVARNLAIDSTRSKHQKMRAKIQSDPDFVYGKNQPADDSTSREHLGLNTLVRQLNEDHKTIIDLAYFEGYTQAEIAGQLSLPLGTVKTKVRQALLALRELTKNELLR